MKNKTILWAVLMTHLAYSSEAPEAQERTVSLLRQEVFFALAPGEKEITSETATQIITTLSAPQDNQATLKAILLPNFKITGRIPGGFGHLTTLTRLDLSGNQLKGEIPDGLYDCRALGVLNLSHNQLSGEIANKIGQLKALQHLNLSHNQLTGTLSEALETCTELRIADLSYNQLTGEIKALATYFNNKTIADLNLSHNAFTGPVLNSLSASYPQLNRLDLSDNQFTGGTQNLEKTPSLVHFNISHNQFKGTLGILTQYTPHVQYLDASHNNFSRHGIDGFMMTKLVHLDLSHNPFEPWTAQAKWSNLNVPINLTHLNLSHSNLRSDFRAGQDLQNALDKMRSLEFLDLSGNPDLTSNEPISFPKSLISLGLRDTPVQTKLDLTHTHETLRTLSGFDITRAGEGEQASVTLTQSLSEETPFSQAAAAINELKNAINPDEHKNITLNLGRLSVKLSDVQIV